MNTNRFYRPAFAFLATAVVITCCQVDTQAEDHKAALTEKEADADFALQGEYSGTLQPEGDEFKYGVQVIALGASRFRAVGYPGGLPGDGWNEEYKEEVESKLSGGSVEFVSDRGKGILKSGEIEILTADGTSVGTLKKVIRKSPTLGKKPPKGAVVLFDGTTAKNFKNGKKTKTGLLQQGVTSHQLFGDVHLHLEFQLSYMPTARGQQRSNSGCYLQGRYEVQILDSFGLAGEDNECGAVYSTKKPRINMCFPPLSWQTYDIDFTAAKYDAEGKKTAPARLTVRHNGVLIHKDVPVPQATRAAPVKESAKDGPIFIQDHNNPLRFRNIWLVEKAKAN